MADQPISGLTALTGANTAAGDLLEIVDVSDTTMAATGTNKKITRDEMKTALLVAPGPIGGTTPGAGTFTTLTSTGNATLGDAEATDTHAIKGATTLLANSASAALLITQDGSGLALEVRDTAGDSTPVIINTDGNVGIGTYANGLFNIVAGVAKLAVVGSSASTDIRSNTDAALVIVNTDQTAGNTAGLHFARADTDDTPNYAGASIVATFSDAQATGQYPKADMVFLTSTAANVAPSEKLRIDSAGNVGIGTASIAQTNVYISKSITGNATSYGIISEGQVQSDVTLASRYMHTNVSSASGVSLTGLYHYNTNQSTILGTVASQFGFFVDASLTGATNNYGFYSNIASAANRFNFYAAGTAPNYFVGVTGIGVTPASTSNLTVAASTTAVSSLNLPHGAAPTSPVNGDMWTTTAGLFIRINGATVGPLS